ncbi:peptidoglycan/LPS O-acetylase OafA/YrhL [Flavimobilis soli]|uniref:Peptidoglycan/LPS O-acetylase OafA/YrhL n=1 Tax=Flavimobilis soli TaxID=442709 RepID=A0A2A9EG73_9MICO|nr:acyltransferase [Flavimobilis soli]PFG37521.1 peptidoglycan/LPS O-acetylase OafA/YrhL [Flavimobilis soli]
MTDGGTPSVSGPGAAAPGTSASRPVRLDALTGLRWWAAFAVFAHHVGQLVVLPPEIARPLMVGTHGVTFFFVLSGFVLTWSSGRAVPGFVPPDAPTFWWRRVARIYPAHLVALALALPVFTTLALDQDAGPWVRPLDAVLIILSVLLLQGWSREPGVLFSGNPAAWTLTCEAFFYALHPAADRALARTTRRGALAVAGAVVGVAVLVRVLVLAGGDVGASVGGLPWPVLRLSEFLLGMALARAVALGWRPRLPVLPVAFGVVALGAWFFAGDDVLVSAGFSEGVVAVQRGLAGGLQEVMTVGTAALVVAVAVRELEGRPSRLAGRFAVRLGEWSFAFYLVHATVVYGLVALLGRQQGFAGLAATVLAFVLSLAAAWALHAGVERPVERRMRSAWDQRRRARAVR